MSAACTCALRVRACERGTGARRDSGVVAHLLKPDSLIVMKYVGVAVAVVLAREKSGTALLPATDSAGVTCASCATPTVAAAFASNDHALLDAGNGTLVAYRELQLVGAVHFVRLGGGGGDEERKSGSGAGRYALDELDVILEYCGPRGIAHARVGALGKGADGVEVEDRIRNLVRGADGGARSPLLLEHVVLQHTKGWVELENALSAVCDHDGLRRRRRRPAYVDVIGRDGR